MSNAQDSEAKAREQKAKRAAYMREWYAKNKEKVKAWVKRTQANEKANNPEKFNADLAKRQKRYRERKKANETPAQRKKRLAANRKRNAEWKKRDPERWRELKRQEAAKLYRQNPQKFLDRAHRRRGLLNEGSVSKEDWEAILARYKNRCAYCRRSGVKLGQDHVQPLTKGGPHCPANVVPCCFSCNTRKNDRTWPFPEPPET